MGDGLEFDPEILRRVWGQILPIASDDYDNAIERMYTTGTVIQDSHLLTVIDDAWFTAISMGGGGFSALSMLQGMQQTILATADAVRYAMDQYAAADTESAERLDTARENAGEMTGPHDVEGQP